MYGLYIHLPFCNSICPYCDFPKKIKKDDEQVSLYLDRLLAELESYSSYFLNIDTIYIGGGTPNSLNNDQLTRLLAPLSHINVKEFTIECNIEFITKDQLLLFKKYGVTRLSIGLQTLNDQGIKFLNRHHTLALVLEKFQIINRYFYNVSCDFIYGYYNETIKDLKLDLKYVKKLQLNHVSFYNLIIEDNTVFKRFYNDKTRDDKLELKMTKLIYNKLKSYGFKQYEFSNYAIPPFRSFHNLKYWNKEEYIGIGLGATSYLEHRRLTNPSLFYQYMQGFKPTIEELSLADEKKEFLILGLRKTEGVNLTSYSSKFNSTLMSDFNLTQSFKLKLLKLKHNFLFLTKKGINLSNFVFREILDHVL